MELIVSALKPAKISKIRLEENDHEKKAAVFVAEDQLSLAIGKGGQNVRLASRLTGWSIDIQTEKSSFAENLKSAVQEAKAQEQEIATVPETEVAAETNTTETAAPTVTEEPTA